MVRLNFKRPDLNIHKPKMSKTMKVVLAMMGLLLLIGLALWAAGKFDGIFDGIFDDDDDGIFDDDDDDPCANVTCEASGVCKVAGTCQPVSGTCPAETNVTDGTLCGDAVSGTVCTAGVCGAPPATDGTTTDGTVTGGTAADMCNSILPLPTVQAARYNIQENNLELGNNFNVTVSCNAGYGPPAIGPAGVQAGTGALPCSGNNTNYSVYGCQACAADYHVDGDACVPCLGGETNDAGDTIATGDSSCDQPPMPEWIIGQNGETCTDACIRSNKTCSPDDWATRDVYNNMPNQMTTGLCQMTQPSQYVSDANMPTVISGNNPITPYRFDYGDGNPAACVTRSVTDGASPNCDGDPGFTTTEPWWDSAGATRQRFCKCV